VLLNVQRQFVDIAKNQQHRLANLLSSIQREVPAQPSQSYQHLASDSDDDSDGGSFATSSRKTCSDPRAGISSYTADVDMDDDDDDDDDDDVDVSAHSTTPVFNTSYYKFAFGDEVISVGGNDDNPAEPASPAVNQSADFDLALSSDDEEMAEFAASFDSQPGSSTAHQSSVVDTGSSSECSGDSDSEPAAASWKQLHSKPRVCKLKAEGVDDVSDFVLEFVHDSAAHCAQPTETTGKAVFNLITGLIFSCRVFCSGVFLLLCIPLGKLKTTMVSS